MAYCTSCGNELTEGASFCSHCGASQAQAGPQTNPQQSARKPRRMNRFLKWGGITFVGFVILMIVIAALAPPTDSEIENGSNRTAERLEENFALLEVTSDVTSPNDHQSAEKHFTAGNDHFRLDNNYYDAIAEFNDAIQLYPQYSEAFLKRGRAFHFLDQPNRAIENYNEVIRLTPDHQKAFLFRADSYNRLCRSMDAIADYDSAIQIEPGDMSIRYGLALAHADIGNGPEAERNLKLAVEAGYSHSSLLAIDLLVSDPTPRECLPPPTILLPPEAFGTVGETVAAITALNLGIDYGVQGSGVSEAEAYASRAVLYLSLGMFGEAQLDMIEAVKREYDKDYFNDSVADYWNWKKSTLKTITEIVPSVESTTTLSQSGRTTEPVPTITRQTEEFPKIPLDPKITPTPTLVGPDSRDWIESATITLADGEIEHFGPQQMRIQLDPPTTTGEVLVGLIYPKVCSSQRSSELTLWNGPPQTPDGIIKIDFVVPGPSQTRAGTTIITVAKKSSSEKLKLAEATFEIVPFDPPKVRLEVSMVVRKSPIIQGESYPEIKLLIKPITDDPELQSELTRMRWLRRVRTMAEFDPPLFGGKTQIVSDHGPCGKGLNADGILEDLEGIYDPEVLLFGPGTIKLTVTVSSPSDFFEPVTVKGSVEVIAPK